MIAIAHDDSIVDNLSTVEQLEREPDLQQFEVILQSGTSVNTWLERDFGGSIHVVAARREDGSVFRFGDVLRQLVGEQLEDAE